MKFVFAIAMILARQLLSIHRAAESKKYPAPRFPSYLKPPKSIDDIMPFARAAVRQTGGRTPLGLVEKGTAALIITEVGADPLVMQAIKRAYDERGVKTSIVGEHELSGRQQRRSAEGDSRHALVYFRARLHGSAPLDGRPVRRSGGAEKVAQRTPPRSLQRGLHQGR